MRNRFEERTIARETPYKVPLRIVRTIATIVLTLRLLANVEAWLVEIGRAHV